MDNDILVRVAKLYANGFTDLEIAKRLDRARETVKKYRNHLGLPSIEAPQKNYAGHDRSYAETPEQTDIRLEAYGDHRYDS